MKIAWFSDLHAPFLSQEQLNTFLEEINSLSPDVVLMAGDIADGPNLISTLEIISEEIKSPVYFVLGNHDFYHSSIYEMREAVKQLCKNKRRMKYLPNLGVLPLNGSTVLLGVDGWGDGRYGNKYTKVKLNDFNFIKELKHIPNREDMFEILNYLGDEAGSDLKDNLIKALVVKKIIILTHVPPWPEAAWHEGKRSDDDYLPFFACKATGDVILEEAKNYKGKITVLCGHTHSRGRIDIAENIQAITASSDYENPKIEILEI